MYNYNFKTKTLGTIFDKVTHFVSNNSFCSISLDKNDYEIVEYANMFANETTSIALALKASAVEDFTILKLYDNGIQGKCSINGKCYSFSIRGNYIYLS